MNLTGDNPSIILFLTLCFVLINSEESSDSSLYETKNETAQSRCPASTSRPGVYLYADKKLCNVYHECDCTGANSSLCSLVKTNVCPVGTIFTNTTNKCESIELYGCETSYLQSLNVGMFGKKKNRTLERDFEVSRKSQLEKDVLKLVELNQSPEPINVTGITEFTCPYGANDRFPDSQICNLFHVCVSRGDQTFDQPFLCPFSSIFRVIDSNTMYCDKRNKNDCVGKAFYRSLDDDDSDIIEKSLLIDANLNSSDCMNTNEIVEDKGFCNLFHLCRDGKDYTYMCENQLLFNPLAQICDYPINVVCYNKKIFKLNEKEKFLSQSLKVNKTSQQQSFKHQQQQQQQQQSQSMTKNVNINLNAIKKNGTQINIYGAKFELICPHQSAKSYVVPDKVFCNVYHQCIGTSGNAFVCDKGQAFDSTINGIDSIGACNSEELVNCAGKLILLENGQRPGKSNKPSARLSSEKSGESEKLGNYIGGYVPQLVANSREELVSGIAFDCRGRANGHWRDSRFCDVFHACISGEQKKTYSCAQLGDRTYFDEVTKRCEFLKNNPTGCPSSSYFQSVQTPPSSPNQLQTSVISDEPSEGWKQFIRSREQFSCLGRLDGFYASRWCNVFYRCFLGVKTEFLCPKMMNSDRLWWVQHGSPQETPQTSAACVWPCETKKPCLSPGGSVIEVGNGKYDESLNEADRVWRSSNCAGNHGLNDVFKLSDQDFNCLGLPEGNFFASKYCNVFHRCTNGKRRDFQCPKATNTPYDLWWNEEKNQCDWPCKVRCTKPIYASTKTAAQIQFEDMGHNEEECRMVKSFPLNANLPVVPVVQKTQPTLPPPPPPPQSTQAPQTFTAAQVMITSKQISGSIPDENFYCRSIGLSLSSKYCNVYYECKQYGQIPTTGFYCVDGFFDPVQRACKPSSQVQCAYNPQLVYPFVSINEPNPPEEVGCSTTIGYYIIHSNRYCNMYYVCDGRSSKPTSYRCYDRINLEDSVFNRELRRCESKQVGSCEGEILPMKVRFQSSPVDHTRLSDLQPLTCRSDQQYLAEHDKYCNLYHSCILGKYQMYACVTLGSFDRTSYFYYTNGDCAAPNAAQCGPNKAIYPYEKLFPNDSKNFKPQAKYAPIISPSLNYKGQASFGSVSLKASLPYNPICSLEREKYLIPHPKYCNVFYECVNGKLTTFACIDSSTGLFSGIFDVTLRACKPFNSIDCPSNTLYTPEFDKGLSKQQGLDESYYNEVKYQADFTFKTESNFSCVGKINGYYESEWCNVFYRCVNGKRIDAKCSSGNGNGDSMLQYDLWWEHQNPTYDSINPIIFIGPDEDAKCEWPCKVKCDKPIYVDRSKIQSSRVIQNRDFDLHPECYNTNNARSAGTSTSSPAVVVEEVPIFNNNNFMNMNSNNFQAQVTQSHYQAVDLESVNPSGFYCEGDGTFRDPIYCNLFHICTGREKKTYQCKPVNNYSQTISIFDQERNFCVSKEEGFSKCNGVIFDSNFMNLPAYRDLPTPSRPCLDAGVFRAYDKDVKYCDLYYWCEKSFSEPLYFYCDFATYGKETAFFNFETKQCESSNTVKCDPPYKVYSNIYESKLLSETKKESEKADTENALKNFLQASPYMMQIVSGLLDPAPGHLSLPSSQFQTTFKCPINAPGYYPNSEYCDIFHYCYNNGQFKTYVCASMQNQYQLWWSHQTEPGRRDNIFCDWPCNLIGPNSVCPPNKRVLMRDRQQIPGGISQQDVLATTCQNTPSTQSHVNNVWNNDRIKNLPAADAFMPLNPAINNILSSSNSNPSSSATVSGYAPCTNSNEWYVSSSTIKCNNEYRAHGFAPDPKDCSKFYRCDQVVDLDGTSTGYLMSCVAGLWWDQSRRMCVSPSEVPCNPYNIINSQGSTNKVTSSGCRGLTCNQVGLTMKNQMKNIPGRPNAFFKCDGQCAVEMTCPLDLIFDNVNQRCEWVSPQFRMSSLKATDKLTSILQKQSQQLKETASNNNNYSNMDKIDINQIKENLEKSLVVDNLVKLNNQNDTSIQN